MPPAPDQWQSVEALYHQALDLPPDRRPAFLKRACPHEEIIREVQSLLSFPPEGDRLLHHSPWSIPATLGPYRIGQWIGSGSTGEVFLARDTRLGRDVALKVLSAHDIGDPAARERFLGEAQSACRLNHPNVVTIHDIGESEGRIYIGMEYVAGSTLHALIPPTGLPYAQAVTYGLAIADAVANAHAAGILHRDLKPANIMVTGDGRLKILDFGLAKPLDPASLPPGQTQSGVISGTPAFMSPEQAEGKMMDARSDIFAFGAVLYQMLTGRPAFQGDSVMGTLASVLKDQPEPLPGTLPRPLVKIVQCCLEKVPERRFRRMEDVRNALLDLRTPPAVSGFRFRRGLAAAGVVILAFLGVGGIVFFRPSHLPPPRVAPVTTLAGNEMHPAFSPDGRRIAFYWDGEKGENPGIYVKVPDQNSTVRLTSGPHFFPAWSPEGKRIAFVQGTSPARPTGDSVYTVSSNGGEVRKLLDITSTGQISWSPDGKWMALARGEAFRTDLVLVSAQDGRIRQFSSPKAPAYHLAPSFSPDGRHLAYANCADRYACDVYEQELASDASPRGAPRPLARLRAEVYGITWVRDGRSLIYSAALTLGTPYLWRVPLHGGKAPQRLDIAAMRARSPSVSAVGSRLVFERTMDDPDIWKYHANGSSEPLIVSSLMDYAPQFSPDGARIAFCSNRGGEGHEVWVAKADGSGAVALTTGLGRNHGSPRWSSDGRWIAFDSEANDGLWHIYAIEYAIETSGGSPRRITTGLTDAHMPFWSPDGKSVYFYSSRTGNFQIWRVPFAGGAEEQVTTQGGMVGYPSADGKTLFYTKDYSGPLYSRPFDGGVEHQVLPYIHYKSFAAAPNGIYFLGRRASAGYYPLEFFEFATQTCRLFAKIQGAVYQGLSVSPDGKSILISRTLNSGSDLVMIENFE